MTSRRCSQAERQTEWSENIISVGGWTTESVTHYVGLQCITHLERVSRSIGKPIRTRSTL